MTVIRPNSVSGINSITAQADEIKVFKSNGTQGGLIIGGANLNATTGISTLLALKVTGNVSIAGTLTYQDVTNVDSIGIITARAGVNVSAGQLDVGSNIKLGNAGVITATSFVGSGANLTGITAGLSNIVEDTSPQLGGTLDTNNQDITFNGAQNVSWDSSAADFIFNDYAKLNLGTDKDFRMYQDTNNTILQSNNTAGGVYLQGALVQIGSETGEAGVKFVKNGAVELYHDNVKALSTSSTGINVWGRSGNGILDIYPTGSAVYSILNLHNTVGGTAYNAQLIATSGQSVYLGSGNTGDVVLRTGNSQNKVVGKHNGATELYHSSNKKLETTNVGVQVSGALNVTTTMHIPDGSIGLQIGNSNDLMLFHDGNNNHIKGTGNHGLIFYTNNTEKAFFRSNGNFVPWTNNAYDIGESNLRWRNIYTNDLNLSNEGSANSVDNTWGNYTIQEGENDLFLINNRSGKKYKFNLTEVS